MTKSIRIISPAGVLDSSFITGAADRLRALGYGVDIAPHAIGSWGRFTVSNAVCVNADITVRRCADFPMLPSCINSLPAWAVRPFTV